MNDFLIGWGIGVTVVAVWTSRDLSKLQRRLDSLVERLELNRDNWEVDERARYYEMGDQR